MIQRRVMTCVQPRNTSFTERVSLPPSVFYVVAATSVVGDGIEVSGSGIPPTASMVSASWANANVRVVFFWFRSHNRPALAPNDWKSYSFETFSPAVQRKVRVQGRVYCVLNATRVSLNDSSSATSPGAA